MEGGWWLGLAVCPLCVLGKGRLGGSLHMWLDGLGLAGSGSWVGSQQVTWIQNWRSLRCPPVRVAWSCLGFSRGFTCGADLQCCSKT